MTVIYDVGMFYDLISCYVDMPHGFVMCYVGMPHVFINYYVNISCPTTSLSVISKCHMNLSCVMWAYLMNFSCYVGTSMTLSFVMMDLSHNCLKKKVICQETLIKTRGKKLLGKQEEKKKFSHD